MSRRAETARASEMSVEYRAERGKWGYRFYRAGKRYQRRVWKTEAEAAAAEHLARLAVENTEKCIAGIPDLTEIVGPPTHRL